MLGSDAFMELQKKPDSPAVDAATSTVSSESVPLIAAVASTSATADATPHLHVSPKLADPSCHWKSRRIIQKKHCGMNWHGVGSHGARH